MTRNLFQTPGLTKWPRFLLKKFGNDPCVISRREAANFIDEETIRQLEKKQIAAVCPPNFSVILFTEEDCVKEYALGTLEALKSLHRLDEKTDGVDAELYEAAMRKAKKAIEKSEGRF